MADDYEVKEVLEFKTGKVHRFYTFKKKACFRRLINSHLAKQMAGYCMIEKDIRTVGVWLDELDEMHTDRPARKGEVFKRALDRKKYNVIKGLFVAALTFYGKCFSKCEGRPVKLERAQLDEKFLEMHDLFMSYRHNFAAHSGAAKLEYVDIVLVLPPKPKLAPPKIYSELFQPDLLSDNGSDEVSFKELITHVKSLVDAKINQLNEKIIKEEVLPKGFDFWIRKKG